MIDTAIAPDQAPAAPERLAGERESFVLSGGLRLRVREWGNPAGPPIVLLHGLRGFSGTWRRLAAALPDYRLVAIDQRGRGESDWDPRRDYYTDAYLADLETVVDALALTRFVLIGHSMGGATAYVYAARHPERLSALIVEDIAPGSSVRGEGAARIRAEMAALPPDFATWAEARDYWRRTRPSIDEAGLEQRLAESLCERGGRIGWRYDAAGISETRLNPDPARVIDLWPVVDAITVPTLVIRGAKSDFCALEAVNEMHQRNPRIAAVTVMDASHYVHDDQPVMFERIIREFLSRAAK
ncbi:alpha/beta hydrolase [Sphingomonadaceae bacterium jetA1]|uniref:alpha/beta fold hydrolase n=1 Tax=Facivitalis istanbulensis TaxID=3075838 RepID=UPI00347ECA98